MSRNHFGWQTLLQDEFGDLSASVPVTLWDSRSGGTQYDDLTSDVDGAVPVTSVTSLQSGQFDVYLPDTVLEVWVQGATSFRYLVQTDDLAAMVAAQAALIVTLTGFMADQLARPQFTFDPAEQAANHALTLIPTVT